MYAYYNSLTSNFSLIFENPRNSRNTTELIQRNVSDLGMGNFYSIWFRNANFIWNTSGQLKILLVMNPRADPQVYKISCIHVGLPESKYNLKISDHCTKNEDAKASHILKLTAERCRTMFYIVFNHYVFIYIQNFRFINSIIFV